MVDRGGGQEQPVVGFEEGVDKEEGEREGANIGSERPGIEQGLCLPDG